MSQHIDNALLRHAETIQADCGFQADCGCGQPDCPWVVPTASPEAPAAQPHTAAWFLERGLQHMQDRAKAYDKASKGGERSIGAAVEAFEAITGDGNMNSGERGWLFMIVLKLVRSQQGEFKADNFEDAAAYCGLMGESAASERRAQGEQA